MIQIYSPGNTEYDKNGDMPIFPTKAEISATLNGTWQLNLEHPIDKAGRWKYIQEDAVVKLPSFNGDQLFRIRDKKKASSGITATAEPIFMDSMYDCFLADVRPTAKNGQEALDIMTAQNAKYSGKSNITKRTTAYYEYKNLIEAINGDDDNSFINRWGGEILFNNFEITINERVGGDYSVSLQYGKNIQKNGITESVDMTGIVTRIYPKAYNGYKLSGSGYVDSPVINSYPIIKVATITFDDVKMAEDAQEDDEENGITVCSTQAELDTALRKKCNEQFSAGIDKPSVNITADMVLLQNTRQYKNYAVLEQVSLGDTIHCRHTKLGITTDARVISLKYDAIKQKVTYVELGDFTYNYFSNVSSSVNRIDQVVRPDGTVMADKIAGFINGAMASLRAQYDIAKKQDVMAILFENLNEESDLYGAMALGTQGLTISKTRTADGRAWDWTTAMTANGLIANIIVAGILSDKTGKNYWDLDKGEFSLSATGFTVDGKPAEDYFKETWSQEEIFNKLTNNGVEQGVFLRNGILYINGSYLQIGKITDKTGDNHWDLDKGEFYSGNGIFSGNLSAAGGTFAGTLYVGAWNGIGEEGEIQVYDEDGKIVGRWGPGAFWMTGQQNFQVSQYGILYTYEARIQDSILMSIKPSQSSITEIDSDYVRAVKANNALVGSNRGYNLSFGSSEYDDPQKCILLSIGDPDLLAMTIHGDSTLITGDLSVGGEKNRVLTTKNFGRRKLSSYEMTSPMFGDIGNAETDENGECIIYISDVFYETITSSIEYQVFLQKEGEGDLWVESKENNYFIVKGSPKLKFSWELKAKQKEYEYNRMEADVIKDKAIGIENLLQTNITEKLEGLLYETN